MGDHGASGNVQSETGAAFLVAPSLPEAAKYRMPLIRPHTPPRSGCGVRSSSWPNSIGACTYSGRLFRVDASLPPGSQATHITHSHTASGTAPHADSRNMAIDANGDLLEVDDGGIYRRTRPQANDGDWFAMDGDIQVTEFHSIAWDANFHRMIGGAQDTGTPEQFEGSEREWESVSAMAGSSPSMTRARPGFPTAIRAITISATFAGNSSTPSPSGRSMCR